MLGVGIGLDDWRLSGPSITAPAQFQAGDWSVADDGTGGDITITITALPDDGGSAITDLEYQIDGGSWVSLAGTTTGDYPVSGLTDDVEVDVAIRAVNAIGDGTASTTKAVTPTTAVTRRVIVVNFLPDVGGLKTITDSRLGGLTPKGAILIMSATTSNKGIAQHAKYSLGVTDGTNHWCVNAKDRDGVLTENTHIQSDTTNMSGLLAFDGGSMSGRAVFDAFVPDGIRLNLSGNFSQLCTLVLFAGDDIEVNAGTISSIAAAGTSVACGFQPDMVLFSHLGVAGLQTSPASSRFTAGIGWAVDAGSVEQHGMSSMRFSGSNDEATAHSLTSCSIHIVPADATISQARTVTGFTPTGFDISSSTDSTIHHFYFAVKIDGASFKLLDDTAKTTTGTQAKTGAGFQADIGLFLTNRSSAIGASGMGLYAVDADLTHGGFTFDSSSAGTILAGSSGSNSSIMQLQNDNTTEFDCAVQSWDADGYTLNFTTAAPGANRRILGLLIGGLD